MRSSENVEKLVRNAEMHSDPETNQAVLKDLLHQFDKTQKQEPAVTQPKIRRTIMRSPITKLAAAAAIIAAVLIGLSQFGGSATSVAWGEVIGRLEASRGVVFRRTMTRSNRPGDDGYRLIYSCPTHSRTDYYKADQITGSLYSDYNAKTLVSIQHDRKSYFEHQLGEQAVRDHQTEADPKAWVQKILSCEYRKLGRKTVEGILCEGLETTDPAFGDSDSPLRSLMLQLWVSVETGYPVLCEGNVVFEADDSVRIEAVLDRFQWDVELDASEFEPKIPPDYESMD
jgi:outer membrane lipoprotein-sorting protein